MRQLHALRDLLCLLLQECTTLLHLFEVLQSILLHRQSGCPMQTAAAALLCTHATVWLRMLTQIMAAV